MTKPSETEYVLTKPKQLEAIQSPARLRIVEYLAANNTASIADIAEWMRVGPHGLYHHFEVLQKAGLVQKAGMRGQGRKKEKLYKLVSRRLRVDAENRKPSYRTALAGVGTSILRMVSRNYEAAVNDGLGKLEGAHRNTAVRHAVFQLTPSELSSFNKDIEALYERYSVKTGSNTRMEEINVTIAVTPRKS